jgi:hypothetical protein
MTTTVIRFLTRTETCSQCGQPIAPTGPRLPPIKQRIYEAVRHRPEISAEQLRMIVWDDPSGGPECRHTLFVHIHQLNAVLAAHGLEVRGSRSGGYRVQEIS